MVLNAKHRQRGCNPSGRGMSIIELLVAMIVLMVGVLGAMSLIVLAIGTNGRNRQQSNSTVLAQMITEKIMSVPANTSPTLTLTDCLGTNGSINTTGSSGGAGSTLLASGDVDFTKTLGGTGAPAGYYMQYTTCGSTGRQTIYDVRWNIKTLSTNTKLITVSARMKGVGTDVRVFSLPVTVRSVAGLGT
jgi:type II secretory pathway pseudopilin PulG